MLVDGRLEQKEFHFEDIFPIAISGKAGNKRGENLNVRGGLIKIPFEIVKVGGQFRKGGGQRQMVLRFARRNRKSLSAGLKELFFQILKLFRFFCLEVKKEDEIGKAGEEHPSQSEGKHSRSVQKGKEEEKKEQFGEKKDRKKDIERNKRMGDAPELPKNCTIVLGKVVLEEGIVEGNFVL